MPIPTPMAGKTGVITGASSGIGLAAAKALAAMGARLLLVVRSRERGEAALRQVRGAAPEAAVELLLCDLAKPREVRSVAAAIAARAPRLDVLINNAGIWNGRRRVTAEGLEETFAVNHLAYHHLTALLTDRLRESAPARVVNVASAAHFQGRMHWDDLQLERGYLGIRAYAQSKLANVLFTYELARRLPGSGVTANCLHPGVVNTNLGRGSLNLFSLGAAFARRLYRTPEEGAVTLVHLASSPAVAGVTGRYFVDREAARSSRRSYLPDDGRRLWEASGALVSRCGG